MDWPRGNGGRREGRVDQLQGPAVAGEAEGLDHPHRVRQLVRLDLNDLVARRQRFEGFDQLAVIHPGDAEAEHRFKELAAAYEVLSVVAISFPSRNTR